MDLKIGVETNEAGEEQRVIEVQGSLDLYNVQSATQAVRPLLEESGVILVVDLSGLEFIDSSGIGMLFHWKHQLKLKGGRFGLRNVSPALQKTLSMGRLNDADG